MPFAALAFLHITVRPQLSIGQRHASCPAASPLGWEGLDEAQLHDAEGGANGIGHRDEGVAHSLVVGSVAVRLRGERQW